MGRKITMVDFVSQLDKYLSLEGFREMIIKKPEWYVELIVKKSSLKALHLRDAQHDQIIG